MKLAELDSELEKNQLSGFWKTRVPSHSSEAPYLWKWEPLLDGLLKASETIGIEQAERRAIRLVSPHLPIKSTSHTLQFTFSIVNPGEVARAHRHNMAAIRFVVQGKGAYTAVDGEKFPMEEGDLILTPNWTWHEHHNESEDPIIWLDGLDGPLIQSLNVLFFEDYEKDEQPITRQTGESLSRLGFARSPKKEKDHLRGVPFRYRLEGHLQGAQDHGRQRSRSVRRRTAALRQSGHRLDLPIRQCRVRFSFSKPERKPRCIATPAQRSITSSKDRVALRWEKVTSNGRREILLSYHFGSGIRTRISPMTRRFCFPSMIDL